MQWFVVAKHFWPWHQDEDARNTQERVWTECNVKVYTRPIQNLFLNAFERDRRFFNINYRSQRRKSLFSDWASIFTLWKMNENQTRTHPCELWADVRSFVSVSQEIRKPGSGSMHSHKHSQSQQQSWNEINKSPLTVFCTSRGPAIHQDLVMERAQSSQHNTIHPESNNSKHNKTIRKYRCNRCLSGNLRTNVHWILISHFILCLHFFFRKRKLNKVL